MSKRLLVLNVEVSGMNKYLFAQLKKRGWELDVVEVPYPCVCRLWALLSTFQFNLSNWKKAFDLKINKLHKMSWVFRKRSQFCEKIIRQKRGQFDHILQIAGTFAPFDPQKNLNPSNSINTSKYTLVLSYTMALSKGYAGWEPYEGEFVRWIEYEKLLYKNAEIICTTNENVKKSLINDYNVKAEKVSKIGYGLTLKRLPGADKDYDGKTVLFIGMDFERKGGFVLLEAFKNVRKEIPDAKLVIVGPNKELIDINQDGVIQLGHVANREKIAELYNQASVFVMPSLMEPFGLVFLEAMAHKLPCIGTSVDAMPEIIQEGQTGYMVAPNDPDALAKRLISLLNQKDRLKQFGANAYDRVQKEFNWENVGKRIDKSLNAVPTHKYDEIKN